jgi:hypothetical protein
MVTCKCGKKLPDSDLASDIMRNFATGDIECADCHHGVTEWKEYARKLERDSTTAAILLQEATKYGYVWGNRDLFARIREFLTTVR